MVTQLKAFIFVYVYMYVYVYVSIYNMHEKKTVECDLLKHVLNPTER